MVAHPDFVQHKLFFGRSLEQNQFRAVLRETMEAGESEDWPFVILLAGSRGMGKTALANQYRVIASTENPFRGVFESLWIPWGEVRDCMRPKPAGQSGLAVETVLDTLYQAASEKLGPQFDNYETTIQIQQQARQLALSALSPANGEDELSNLPGTTVEIACQAARRFISRDGEIEEESLQELAAMGLKVSAGRARRLRESIERRLRTALSSVQYETYAHPIARLTGALGEDLKQIAQGANGAPPRPLIITLDSYEIVESADRWVRKLMRAAGSKVIWILCAQNDLWRSAQRHNEYFAGYGEEWPDRIIPQPLNRLSQKDVAACFSHFAPNRDLSTEELQVLSRATRGIPLAVFEASLLWRRNASLEEIAAISTHFMEAAADEQLVRKFTERFLRQTDGHTTGRRGLVELGLARIDDRALHATLAGSEGSGTLFRNRTGETPGPAGGARGLNLGEEKAWAYASLGNVLSDQGLHDEAIAAYRRSIELDPNDAAPHIGLGNIYFDQGLHNAAIAAYGQAGELAPLDAASYYGLGNVFSDQGLYEQALAAYRRASKLNPQDAYPHCGLGNVYFDQGLYEKAIEAYLHAIELDPNDGYPLCGLGNVYTEQGKYEHAVKAFLRATELDPNDATSHCGLGTAYSRLGSGKQAIDAFLRSSELEPKDPLPHSELGALYSNQGMHRHAVASFLRAIELVPGDMASRYGLANAYQAQGLSEEAIAAYLSASELNPRDAGVFQRLGNLYRALGRLDEAIEAYQIAAELAPQNAAPYYGLGNVYSDQGLYRQALGAYLRANDLDPFYPHPYNGLGNIYRAQGQHELAIAAYHRATELDPQYAYLHMSVASCYKKLGLEDEFLQSIQLARGPVEAQDEYNRACFEAICGNTDAALGLLRQAWEKNNLDIDYARRDPDFDFIRDDPRFAAFFEELKAAQDETALP